MCTNSKVCLLIANSYNALSTNLDPFPLFLTSWCAQLYQREHELLRELVHVDSALDDYERRSEVRGVVSCISIIRTTPAYISPISLFSIAFLLCVSLVTWWLPASLTVRHFRLAQSSWAEHVQV